MKTILHLILAGLFASSVIGAESPKSFLWVWLHNLDGRWKDYVDFAADWKCTGVVIWGLDGWKQTADAKGRGSEAFCRELVAYAHARGVQVIHGCGLNGYDEGKHICKTLPTANAVIPDRLKDTAKGKDSAGYIFCPSNPDALKLLRETLLRAKSGSRARPRRNTSTSRRAGALSRRTGRLSFWRKSVRSYGFPSSSPCSGSAGRRISTPLSWFNSTAR